jgi:hypothetical protein
MSIELSEDTMIFIGFTPKIAKIKSLDKILQEFANAKQTIDPSQRFNLILFQESGPIYLDDFTLDFNNVLSLLKKYEKKNVQANIAGGIMLTGTFINEVYKRISEKAFRLIILMDKRSISIPEYYYDILYELLDKLKDMPFYLDILWLGEEDEEIFPKLENFAKRYGGHAYEIRNPKTLQDILFDLAKGKTLDENQYRTTVKEISEANITFYENLAKKPDILLTSEKCSICFKKNDVTVVKCPNCDTIAHLSCWALWAQTSSIGIPYIFRCHNCYHLIKLDKNFVEIVQTGKISAPKIEFKKRDKLKYLKRLESKRKLQVIKAEDPLSIPKQKISADDEFYNEWFEDE